ncbi:MAG: hypothetical protein ACKN9T_14050 [Candidatus Methylumidiphilus sp.]
MPTKALRAQYDGKPIVPDENSELIPNPPSIVTILPVQPLGQERMAWSKLAGEGLAKAYGEEEPEYALSDCLAPRILPKQP